MSKNHEKFLFFGVDINIQESLKITLMNFDFSEGQNVNLCLGNSLDILPKLAKEESKFDVVLLDGDHNYYTVSKELSYLNNLTHDKSLVIVDDYHGRWSENDLWYSDRQDYKDISIATKSFTTDKHGVKPAVDEFISNNPSWKLSSFIQGEPILLSRS